MHDCHTEPSQIDGLHRLPGMATGPAGKSRFPYPPAQRCMHEVLQGVHTSRGNQEGQGQGGDGGRVGDQQALQRAQQAQALRCGQQLQALQLHPATPDVLTQSWEGRPVTHKNLKVAVRPDTAVLAQAPKTKYDGGRQCTTRACLQRPAYGS